MQAEAAEAQVSIETPLPANLPLVIGNRVQIARVLVNLLRNAIEAMADANTDRRQITITASEAEDMVTVAVEDTGPGVPAGLRPVHAVRNLKPDGMGLGLSICRAMVEANGGTLTGMMATRVRAQNFISRSVPSEQIDIMNVNVTVESA